MLSLVLVCLCLLPFALTYYQDVHGESQDPLLLRAEELSVIIPDRSASALSGFQHHRNRAVRLVQRSLLIVHRHQRSCKVSN